MIEQKLDDYEIEYKTPTPSEAVHFYETFDSVAQARSRWIPSQTQKEDQEQNVYKYEGRWDFDLPERRIFPNDRALILRSKAKHAAISARLNRKFEFISKPLIVQYEVTFQNGMDCGGAYIKLLSDSKDMKLEDFHDKTPYTIMFGPDKCGSDIKLHFIFRHKNPLNGTFSEKHAKRPSNRVEDAFTDKKPHLYRLVLKPDNKFEVFVDGALINQGNLLEDMEPPVNPPIEIEDPADAKPADWDERERIPDEKAVKPADWDEDAPPKIPDPNALVPAGWLLDEPEMVADPAAKMPDDWDESMDGEWEAPLVQNPKCVEAVGCGPWQAPLVENPNFRGKWQAPLVDNPNYKGKWSRRKIPNPDYFEDKEPFKMTPIAAVGLEIWTMTDNVLFDNFIVSDKEAVVAEWTEATYGLKMRALERDSRGVLERIINYSNSHPWLYAVYTILIGLPVVLIIAFCCGGTGAHEKKTEPKEPLPGYENDAEEEDDEDRDQLLKSRKQKPLAQVKAQQQHKKNGALTKDDLEQAPPPPNKGATPNRELDEQEEEEEEDDEGWVQTGKPTELATKGKTEQKLQPVPVKQEEEDEEDEQEEETGEKSGDEDEEEEEEEAKPLDELIPDKEDGRENSQLKKRRTRRD